MATSKRRRRPRSDWSEDEKQAWRDQKLADKQIANDAVEKAARALAQRPDLIDAFRALASRIQDGRSLRNALAVLGQRPDAIRVHSAMWWSREDRRVLPEATPIRVIARRRGGKRTEDVENKETGQTEEVGNGTWSGYTAERVFDVRDTVPRSKTCRCGTEPGERCPDSCPVLAPVMGPIPTRQEVAELLDHVLREEGGFDPDLLDGGQDEAEVDEL